ncbi:RNA polymerase subunit sigma-70 [Paenibacillus selenitireducens]|uniref:RNA polymerase subunit sigma-70 n=1 Tax=Paenibacillus selenitireducens TaxID=1324314 RepID=A0A1T2WZ96_9BACL|nr:RNA polymerase sigma factor [Paenibacillus selenitireducens]OPA72932.1 RNA polymerase subunit sigma-70 [Paenibacillus selenitireducens]
MNDREMFETYKDQVYRLCRYMLNHRSDAEDVCQEVFFKAMIVDRTTIKDIKPWLMQITVNECNTVLKRRQNGRRKEKLSFLLSLSRPSVKIEEQYEQAETADEFSTILSKMPDKLRIAIVLRFSSDMSIAETAQVLQVAEGTVKSRVNRGLHMLRSMMNESPNLMSEGDVWPCTPSVKTK